MPEAAAFLGSTPAQYVLFTGKHRQDACATPPGAELNGQDACATPDHAGAAKQGTCARPHEAELHGRDACATSHEAGGKRRTYNRDYMRLWRERNRERYRAANRAYQRKRALRRKAQRESAGHVAEPGKCWYQCGRPAVTTIERVHPETWQKVSVPYCGFC